MPPLVVVTGDKELDARLGQLPAKLQKKLVRKALRKGGKRVLDKFRAIIRAEAYETGAYERSTSVRALRRSRQRIGVTIHVDRDKFFERYQAAYGHKPHPAAGDSEPFYVPAAIEFGTETRQAIRPQRRALYENEQQILQDFRQDLIEFTRSEA
jgi:hypothetical protein